MAIMHFRIKMVKRSDGRSSVAAAAYRSGEKIKNQRDGVTHNYRRRKDVVAKQIFLPTNAPREYQDRTLLWNTIESVEKRCDSQTAREIEVALPVELNRKEQLQLLEDYVQHNFVNLGMIADVCVHDKLDGNPHAHILLTTRTVKEDGFGKKNRQWGEKARVFEWRESWAVLCNMYLQEYGVAIDHRSYKEQGVDKLPTVHLGAAHKMEKRGIWTEKGDYNREVMAYNAHFTETKKEIESTLSSLDQEIKSYKEELAVLQQEQEREVVNTVLNVTKKCAANIQETVDWIVGASKQIKDLERELPGVQKHIDYHESLDKIQRLRYEIQNLVHEKKYLGKLDFKRRSNLKQRIQKKEKSLKSLESKHQKRFGNFKLKPFMENERMARNEQREKIWQIQRIKDDINRYKNKEIPAGIDRWIFYMAKAEKTPYFDHILKKIDQYVVTTPADQQHILEKMLQRFNETPEEQKEALIHAEEERQKIAEACEMKYQDHSINRRYKLER
jgi:hypothetical protein